MRKFVLSQGAWDNVSNESKETIKKLLIECLKNETSQTVRSELINTISDLVASPANRIHWPEFLDILLEFVNSKELKHRQSAILILGQICTLNPELLRSQVEMIMSIAEAGLNDNSTEIQLSTIAAGTGFIMVTKKKMLRKFFYPLIPKIMNFLSVAIGENRNDDAQTVLQLFGDWIEIDQFIFRPYLGDVTNLILKICFEIEDQSLLYQAIYFLSSLISLRPKDMQSIDGFIPNYIKVILETLLKLDDSIEVWKEMSLDDEENESVAKQVESCLDVLSGAIGGEALIPHIMDPIISFIGNPDWKHQHAGLTALSLIAGGCKNQFLQSVHDIVHLILPHMQSEHPRIRWAACNAIEIFSHILSPIIQVEYHNEILPEIIKLIDESDFTKIQVVALSTIVTFCEKLEQDTIAVHLDVLLKKLYTHLSSDKKEVLQETITAIAVVASKAKELFVHYYNVFIPLIKNVLEHTHGPEYRLLRGKAFECISTIGLAVGKDVFLPDANEILKQLQATKIDEFGSDDSNSDFLLEASVRICTVLKEDFIPYLPIVMPLILSFAGMKSQYFLNDGDVNEDLWEHQIVDGKTVALHTVALDQKALACELLLSVIKTLKDGVANYYNDILEIITPLLSFPYHRDIKATAITTVSPLLSSILTTCQKNGDLSTFLKLHDEFYVRLVNLLDEEEELDMQALICEAIADCIQIYPEGQLSEENVHRAVKAIVDTTRELDAYREKKYKEIEEEYEEEFIEIWNERIDEEYNLLAQLAEIAGVLARNQINTFIPFFEKIADFVLNIIKKDSFFGNIYLGYCMIDDVVENSKGRFVDLAPLVLPQFLDSLQNQETAVGVRHASVYGLGVFAQYGGEYFVPYIQRMHPDLNFYYYTSNFYFILESLNELISFIENGPKDPDGLETRDNAICAFGKILLYQKTDLENLLPLWLSWLPLNYEVLEATVCHELFSKFVEQNNEFLWGKDFVNLPKVLDVTAFFYTDEGRKFVKEETQMKMCNLLKSMYSDNPNLIIQAIATLSETNQNILNSLILSKI